MTSRHVYPMKTMWNFSNLLIFSNLHTNSDEYKGTAAGDGAQCKPDQHNTTINEFTNFW